LAGKPAAWNGKRVRAPHPFEDRDRRPLETIGRAPPASAQESRRRSAAVRGKLRLLRAHHLMRKVPGTHRYQISPKGRQMLTAAIAASHATANALLPKAAR
jgi:hypothetical protein